jgi:murein L,D-transpeptidase YcbB/YkuD
MVLAGCLAASLAGLTACGGGTAAHAPASTGVEAALARVLPAGDLTGFYRARGFRPLWVEAGTLRPEARQLAAILAQADSDNLPPARYRLADLQHAMAAARGGNAEALAQAEWRLSQAFAAYVRDLHQPSEAAQTVFVDPGAAPARLGPAQLLDEAARAPSLAAHLQAVRHMNPVYEGLRTALAAAAGDAEQARLIRANMERARAIPADPGPRFILVDTAGARLWLYEKGRAVDTMKVVVGKRAMATPSMAALVRFAVVNPYWNVPPDLVRDKIAPRILAGDADYLKRERLELVSDWSDHPEPLDAALADWSAIAAGIDRPHVRQLPGGRNMMGRVKFMFPNQLGIYLHDTPDRQLFALADRRRSSGCVRVEDARRLARWLFNGRDVTAAATAAPEQRVDLPAPVPVYIAYFTALPSAGTIARQPDAYGRDPRLIALLESRRAG